MLFWGDYFNSLGKWEFCRKMKLKIILASFLIKMIKKKKPKMMINKKNFSKQKY
jgi:hypothetical protein